jgi:hypothetical protein
MPKVVTFSLFLPLSISSCPVWAIALQQQKQKRDASIFFIAFLLGEIGRSVRAALSSASSWGLTRWWDRAGLEGPSKTVDAQAMSAPSGPRFKAPRTKSHNIQARSKMLWIAA